MVCPGHAAIAVKLARRESRVQRVVPALMVNQAEMDAMAHQALLVKTDHKDSLELRSKVTWVQLVLRGQQVCRAYLA